MPWKEVTDTFSEKRRHYKDTYLEIDQVFFNKKETPVCEVSLFSSKTSPYEIYVYYGALYGIIYTDAKHGYDLQKEIMSVFEEEYKKRNSKVPSKKFVHEFREKYHVELAMDTYFDADIGKMSEALDSLVDAFE